MSHRCPECGCTVLGGDWSSRPCWMCEGRVYGGRSWWRVGFYLGIFVGLLYLWSRS